MKFSFPRYSTWILHVEGLQILVSPNAILVALAHLTNAGTESPQITADLFDVPPVSAAAGVEVAGGACRDEKTDELLRRQGVILDLGAVGIGSYRDLKSRSLILCLRSIQY
jgi:hypothetical protein